MEAVGMAAILVADRETPQTHGLLRSSQLHYLTIHYNAFSTLRCITIPHIGLYYSTLQCSALNYIKIHYITYITLQDVMYCNVIQCITIQHIEMRHITYITLRYITLADALI